MSNPKNALNNVEYLCLKMLLNPGRSQRFYRRALMAYTGKGVPDDSDDVGYGLYFRKRGKYQGRLWTDRALKTVEMSTWRGKTKRPKVSALYLTASGQRRAIAAGAKIGITFRTMNTEDSPIEPPRSASIVGPADPRLMGEPPSRPIGFR